MQRFRIITLTGLTPRKASLARRRTSSQRSWISWCPTLGFWKSGDHDYDYDYILSDLGMVTRPFQGVSNIATYTDAFALIISTGFSDLRSINYRASER